VGEPLPDEGVTVAVKVTDWPKTEGFVEEVRVVVVAMPEGLIMTETALDVLPVKLGAPEYSAVNESIPTGSVVVVRIAVLPLRLAVPTDVVPLKNCTVPVGVPAPGATTAMVAVSVTVWPEFAVEGVAERPVLVLAWLTISVVDEELVTKFGAPLYTAVIELDPTARAEVVKLTVPLAPRVAVSSVVVPSSNATVPVGVPAPGASTPTLAVKVTAWP
jgi:hypothetical protein